jgi:hypothetical protein
MTTWAEAASLAGIGQQIIVAAPITINTRKAMVEVAAGEEALEYPCLYGPADESGRIEFLSCATRRRLLPA